MEIVFTILSKSLKEALASSQSDFYMADLSKRSCVHKYNISKRIVTYMYLWSYFDFYMLCIVYLMKTKLYC